MLIRMHDAALRSVVWRVERVVDKHRLRTRLSDASLGRTASEAKRTGDQQPDDVAHPGRRLANTLPDDVKPFVRKTQRIDRSVAEAPLATVAANQQHGRPTLDLASQTS
jgi:hypothetical protein